MIVSVCVVAYNEEKVLGKLLEDIQAQDYDHEKMEVVLIDSMSTDSTKEIMDILKGLHNEGRTVILITHDNDIAAQAKRVIKIKDGKVESDSGQIVPVEELQTAGA